MLLARGVEHGMLPTYLGPASCVLAACFSHALVPGTLRRPAVLRRFRADMEEAARHREVLQHCHEKLAVLLPGGYIKTRKGRELAEPLHAEILAFMEEGDGAAGDR